MKERRPTRRRAAVSDTVQPNEIQVLGYSLFLDPQIQHVQALLEKAGDLLRLHPAPFVIVGLTIALALPIFLVVVTIAALVINRQIHAPLIRMTDELKHIQDDRFEPAALGSLPERRDEVGYLAREYLQMGSAVLNRQTDLRQEADEVRAEIR